MITMKTDLIEGIRSCIKNASAVTELTTTESHGLVDRIAHSYVEDRKNAGGGVAFLKKAVL